MPETDSTAHHTGRPIKFGVSLWSQHTDWPSFREAAMAVDGLRYDSLWTGDHVYPFLGDLVGPVLRDT